MRCCFATRTRAALGRQLEQGTCHNVVTRAEADVRTLQLTLLELVHTNAVCKYSTSDGAVTVLSTRKRSVHRLGI